MTQQQDNWLERFEARLCQQRMGPAVRDLKIKAPGVYSELLSDLDAPLEAQFESALADSLQQRDPDCFRPADVLLPAMARAVGVANGQVQGLPNDKAAAGACNHCGQVQACWKALRAGAVTPELRARCPNNTRLEALVTKA